MAGNANSGRKSIVFKPGYTYGDAAGNRYRLIKDRQQGDFPLLFENLDTGGFRAFTRQGRSITAFGNDPQALTKKLK